MIPLVLHQTWKSAALPAQLAQWQQSWKALNPQLDHRFYDDDQCRALFAESFGHLLDAYDALPFAVMRADVFRYAVLFRHGGLYADLDMECLRTVLPLLRTDGVLLSVEAKLGRRRQSELGYPRPMQIANCIMAAPPGHRLFSDAVDRTFAEAERRRPLGRNEVEDVSGPRMLTRLFYEEGYENVTVLPQILLMAPLEYPRAWPIGHNIHARHHNFGSWKHNVRRLGPWRRFIERNRLPSPFATLPVSAHTPSR